MSAVREMSEAIQARKASDARSAWRDRHAALQAWLDGLLIVAPGDPRLAQNGGAQSAKHSLQGKIHALLRRTFGLGLRKVLIDRSGSEAFDNRQPLLGGSVKDNIGGEGQDELVDRVQSRPVLGLYGQQAVDVAHSNLSEVLQRGDDAESPGRETDPAVKPEARS